MFKKLESLRGVAAVMVVLYHSRFFCSESPNLLVSNSYIFVDFFFVLSGFVMSSAYEQKIGKTINFLSYTLIRLGRLYPLHAFTLACWIPYLIIKLYLFNHGFGGKNPLIENNISVATFLSNATLTHALGFHDHLSWNWPSWSISLEFFTYILFYIYIRYSSDRAYLLAPALISILSYTLLFSLTSPTTLDHINDFGILRCVGGFFAGIFTYRLSKNRQDDDAQQKFSFLFEGGAVLLTLASVTLSSLYQPILYLTIPAFATSIYIFSRTNSGAIGNLLLHPLLRRVGERSYSMYLNHGLVVAGFSNVFARALQFPLEQLPDGSQGIVSYWSTAINIVMLLAIFFLSKYTYKYIEIPCRDIAKNYAYNRQTAKENLLIMSPEPK